MTDQQHPITPPDELVTQWTSLPLSTEELLVIAYRAGSDMELEACCAEMDSWVALHYLSGCKFSQNLRAARRPKPPSLKERALTDLKRLLDIATANGVFYPPNTIRRALEALPND